MARRSPPRAYVGRSLLLLAAAAGLALLTWAVLVTLPPYFAPRSAFPTASEAVTAQNDVRTTLLQAAGALVLLLSAGLGAGLTGRQLQLNRQGQITERFTRAVDQLGSPHVDVRLGGIYALERIARDSTPDRPTIAEILCAYVREHTAPTSRTQRRTGQRCGPPPSTPNRRESSSPASRRSSRPSNARDRRRRAAGGRAAQRLTTPVRCAAGRGSRPCRPAPRPCWSR
jgi:hypothetical protein